MLTVSIAEQIGIGAAGLTHLGCKLPGLTELISFCSPATTSLGESLNSTNASDTPPNVLPAGMSARPTSRTTTTLASLLSFGMRSSTSPDEDLALRR